MKINTYVTPEKLAADLAISDTDVQSAFMTQASMHAHYAVLHAKAQRQVDQAEMVMEIIQAKADKQLRDAAAAAGEKTTEPGIEKAILRNIDFIRARQNYNDARMIASLAKSAMVSWEQRRDMLIQLGADKREEMKGELRIKERTTIQNSKRELVGDLLRDSKISE